MRTFGSFLFLFGFFSLLAMVIYFAFQLHPLVGITCVFALAALLGAKMMDN